MLSSAPRRPSRLQRPAVCKSEPGLQLQRLTTRQPDDGMLECAIVSMNVALYGLPKDAPRTEEGWAILTSYEQSEPDYVFPQKGEDKQ